MAYPSLSSSTNSGGTVVDNPSTYRTRRWQPNLFALLMVLMLGGGYFVPHTAFAGDGDWHVCNPDQVLPPDDTQYHYKKPVCHWGSWGLYGSLWDTLGSDYNLTYRASTAQGYKTFTTVMPSFFGDFGTVIRSSDGGDYCGVYQSPPNTFYYNKSTLDEHGNWISSRGSSLCNHFSGACEISPGNYSTIPLYNGYCRFPKQYKLSCDTGFKLKGDEGFTPYDGICVPEKEEELGAGNCPVGNPCNPATGNKAQTELDYSGPDGLAVSRSYNSLVAQREGQPSGVGKVHSSMGVGWREHNAGTVLNLQQSQLNSDYSNPNASGRTCVFETTQWNADLPGSNLLKYWSRRDSTGGIKANLPIDGSDAAALIGSNGVPGSIPYSASGIALRGRVNPAENSTINENTCWASSLSLRGADGEKYTFVRPVTGTQFGNFSGSMTWLATGKAKAGNMTLAERSDLVLDPQDPSSADPDLQDFYTLTTADGSKQVFDHNGLLLRHELAAKTGEAPLTLTYSYLPSTRYDLSEYRIADGGGNGMEEKWLLSTVTSSSGHQLSYTYKADSSGKRDLIATITTPGGGIISYSYDNLDRLTRVAYPDGGYRDYLYENAASPYLLTGISDENHSEIASGDSNQRYSFYQYAAQIQDGVYRAIGTRHAQVSGGTNRDDYKLTYESIGDDYVTVSVEDSQDTPEHTGVELGDLYRMVFKRYPNGWQLRMKYRKKATSGYSLVLENRYDEAGRISMVINNDVGSRSVTKYTWMQGDGYLLKSVEQVYTATGMNFTASKVDVTQWYDETLGLPSVIERVGDSTSGLPIVTSITYDPELKKPISISRSGYKPDGTAVTQTSVMAYDGKGRVVTTDGPRTDVADTTTLAYYDCATGYQCGQLHTMTNALGQVTTFNEYSGDGQPTKITDPNGLVSEIGYTARGWTAQLKSYPSGQPELARYTYYSYYPNGQVKTISNGAGSSMTMVYYPDNRLKRVTDADGNYVEYQQYDRSGAGKTAKIFAADGIQLAGEETVRGLYGRIDNINQGTAADQVTTDFSYASNKMLSKITTKDSGGLDQGILFSYDWKGNLLKEIKNARNSSEVYATMGYDNLQRLNSITDANGANTSYDIGDFGRVWNVSSDDAGSHSYNYDAAGNLVSSTDARGISVTMSYDALNRMTLQDFPNDTDISYVYDNCANGIGRLCTRVDGSGTTTYSYNGFGQVLTETLTRPDGSVSQLSYAYDSSNGKLSSMTYPSGRLVNYDYYDSSNSSAEQPIGRARKVTTQDNAAAAEQVVVDNLKYLPFGPMKEMTYGNGIVETRTYDTAYRLTGLKNDGLYDLSYSRDGNGRIVAIDDALTPGENQQFGYNVRGNLTAADGGYGSRSYVYDNNDNRTAETIDGETHTYHYDDTAAPNRLTSIDKPGQTVSYLYDANGNVTQKGDLTFEYNDANRISKVYKSGQLIAEYGYNALGQRVSKSTIAPVTKPKFVVGYLGNGTHPLIFTGN